MRALPLRVKVALWSALMAGGAMGLALFGIRYFLQYELQETLDRRLDRVASEIFWNLDQRPGGPAEVRTIIADDLIPPSAASHLIEIIGAKKQTLYRSANLKNTSLGGGLPELHEVNFRERPYRVGTYYHKSLILHLGASLANDNATLDRVSHAIVISLPAVLLFSLAGGLLVAVRALRPVKKITDAARRITTEDLTQRLPVPAAKDEIHELTEVLNKTFEQLEKGYTQAVHFASDASHQLKTPITVMRSCIESLLKQPGLSPEHCRELDELLQQTRRLSSLAEGLLLLARADAGRLIVKAVEIDLRQLIEGCLEDAEVLAAQRKLRIEHDLPEKIPAIADEARVEQVLLNLLENAVKYNRDGGLINVSAGTDEDGVFIIVASTGTPIPGEKMPVIFNRFTRGESDEQRVGHGLGLSIARELARAQGGNLRLLRSDEEITEFEIRLLSPGSKKAVR